jgi:penicillin amidase
MKFKSFILTVITVLLVFALNKSWKVGGLQIPAIGKFISPQDGFWLNAEPINKDFSEDLEFPGIKREGQCVN